MKQKHLMTFTAVLALFNGLTALLAPEAFLAPFGVSTDVTGILMTRYYGGAALGLAVFCWTLRNVREREVMRAVALAFFVVFVSAFVVGVFAQLAGQMNGLGWAIVVIDLFIATGYGYFALAGSSRPRSNAARREILN